MVEVSKKKRGIGLKLYAVPCTVKERVCRAKALDTDLARWLRSPPVQIRIADESFSEPYLKLRRRASYALKKSVVLKSREDQCKCLRGLFLLALKQVTII